MPQAKLDACTYDIEKSRENQSRRKSMRVKVASGSKRSAQANQSRYSIVGNRSPTAHIKNTLDATAIKLANVASAFHLLCLTYTVLLALSANNLPNYIGWPPLGFKKCTAQILTNHANPDELQPTK